MNQSLSFSDRVKNLDQLHQQLLSVNGRSHNLSVPPERLALLESITETARGLQAAALEEEVRHGEKRVAAHTLMRIRDRLQDVNKESLPIMNVLPVLETTIRQLGFGNEISAGGGIGA